MGGEAPEVERRAAEVVVRVCLAVGVVVDGLRPSGVEPKVVFVRGGGLAAVAVIVVVIQYGVGWRKIVIFSVVQEILFFLDCHI